MLSSMGISAGRFGYSALVIFDKPTPRMSANASNSWLSGSHGTEFTAPDSEAAEGIACRARSIARRRWRIAAIWAAEMRAPPRFASLRSGSPNDSGRDGSLTSNRPGILRKPSTTLSGFSMLAPSRRRTGRTELVVTRSS